MNINLSLLKSSAGDTINVNTVIESFQADFGKTDEISVNGNLTNNAGRIELNLMVSTVFHTECARCLEQVSFEVSYEFEDRIVFEESDEYISLESDEFNLDEYVYEELSLRLPFRVLCDDDCKGLCPTCGINLNNSSCQCDNDNIDPRLAVLKQLLDKKED
ncbi:MAG: DUF177 domain-containing protein [Eubacteriales bacterium]|nr:DUF177 domain-containing protein [Eubacteriales bacterium]